VKPTELRIIKFELREIKMELREVEMELRTFGPSEPSYLSLVFLADCELLGSEKFKRMPQNAPYLRMNRKHFFRKKNSSLVVFQMFTLFIYAT